MIKIAAMTLAMLVVVGIRITLMIKKSANDRIIRIMIGCSMAWLAVFGIYFGWLVLLVMIRQVGAAMLGK